MMRKLTDVTLETIGVEHYLFDLGYSIEKCSEIYDMDKETVKRIYDNYKETILPKRINK